MSERHSGQAGTRAGNEMDSPPINYKYSSFRHFSSTSSFQDSGYSELKSCSFDNTDKEFFGNKERGPTLNYEHPEASNPGLTHPLETPTKKKRFVFVRKEIGKKTPELWETPKLSGRKWLRRARLTLSFSPLKRDSESQNSSVESSISQVLNFEKSIPSSASGFPRQNNFSALVTSTLKPEETTSSSQKLRLNFSQQKTSTVDDSKDDCSLFEVECLSPIQGNNFQDSVTPDFSDSSLSVNDENTHPELLGSSSSGTTCETDEDIFEPPVSNLVADFKFKARQRLFPSTEVRGYSTPEDSGFNSLSLDKIEDSFSDQESSFQELLQTHKGTLKAGDTIRGSRRIGRLRRLSTLREQGSQSETEEENQIIHSDSETTPAAASDISESQPSSDSQSGELILAFKDLSNTPALQLVHELFMRNKRRFQQSGACEFSEEEDEGKIAVLQCVLAGLIGKKMGIEKLDILTELKYRNLRHVLSVVLDSLTEESLCSVWRVSRNWRQIIVQNRKANQRRKFYLTHLKTDAEHTVLNVQDAATRLHLSNRSALRSVQAQARTPSSQKEQVSTFSPWGEVLTPISSSSIIHSHSKQEEYVKVAKTLFIDEALKPCPRCQSPAKYQPYKKRGLCSRKACGFDFCVICLCAYHGSEECSRRAANPRNRKDPLPGSAQSKRNLKRL